jgi:thiamine-phosphate pyrophosphorylase
MLVKILKRALCFYFITDDSAPDLSPLDQVNIAINAGVTIIQYRNKAFALHSFEEVVAIRKLCKNSFIPFIVNDNILLAKAVMADGVHLGQKDEDPAIARGILGSEAIIGTSVHNPEELKNTDLSCCNYIGTGPVFPTATKADAQKGRGLSNLEAVAKKSPLPVVAIGGITSTNAKSCFERGATGIAVISSVTRSKDPEKSAQELSASIRNYCDVFSQV